MTTEREGPNPLPADAMSGAVARLIDTMAGVDPEWRFQDWLQEAAEQHLDLVEADLTRERLRLEQRLHRLEAVQRRMSDDSESSSGVQRNLFDCFEPVDDAAFSAIGRRSSEARVQAEQEEEIPHPARLYIDLLPGEATDDPLLAVCASAMLGVVDDACRDNEGVATLSQIFEGMLNLGVSPDEVDEALDHLLTTEPVSYTHLTLPTTPYV